MGRKCMHKCSPLKQDNFFMTIMENSIKSENEGIPSIHFHITIQRTDFSSTFSLKKHKRATEFANKSNKICAKLNLPLKQHSCKMCINKPGVDC